MTKLVGYKKITSKKSGKDFCVASVVQDVSEREKENGFIGQKVDEIFLPEAQLDLLKPSDIGKELLLDYELSGGRAYLVNVAVK
ncbi:hypothetical protein [Roseburia inulinivorans]|jgi:hypothetical protein|uniref:hypothetical protein n=1 Tax=Roseburia inulinivorans TaxID=360807 RepID=UPI003AB6AA6C